MKNTLLIVLAAAAIASGIFAWQQHEALRALRATRAGLAQAERDEYERKLEAARRQTAEAGSRIVAADENAAADETVSNDTPRGGRAARLADRDSPRPRDLMNDPDIAKLMAAQQKSQLDGRYAALFKKLNLGPAEIEKLKSLLVDKQNVVRDVLVAARSQGLERNSPEIQALMQQSNAEIDASLQTLLGGEKYAQYQDFERTAPQRNLVSQLDQRLSYSATPLTPTQSEQLIQVLAANAAPDSATRNRVMVGAYGLTGSGGPMSSGAAITNEAIAQTQSFLSPAQVEALRQVQAEQAAQAKIVERVTDHARQQNAPKRTAPAPATP